MMPEIGSCVLVIASLLIGIAINLIGPLAWPLLCVNLMATAGLSWRRMELLGFLRKQVLLIEVILEDYKVSMEYFE